MRRSRPPRARTAIKVYLGLLAICVLLCGALAYHIEGLHNAPIEMVSPQREAAAPPNHGQTINWGGAKR